MDRKIFWSRLGLGALFVAGYALLQLLVSAAYGTALSLAALLETGPQARPEALLEAVEARYMAAVPYISLVANGLAALAIWGVCALRRRRLGPGLGFRPLAPAQAALCAAFGLSVATALFVFLNLLPLPEALLEGYAAQSSVLLEGPLAVRLVSIALAAPLLEEMLFRGLVYGTLREGMPRGWAILLSSLAFGLLHGHPLWMAYAALLGAILCLVKDACGSLWAAVVFHGLVNLTGSFLLPACPWAISLVALFLAVALSALLWVRLGLGGERLRSGNQK